MPEQHQREVSTEEMRNDLETLKKAESFRDKLFGKRYRISSVIGYGGMGYVLKAHDTELNRTVAIKVLHQDFLFRDKVLQRFVEEARTVASIKDKANIVEVYDISREDTDERDGNRYVDEFGRKYPWFVMEYLPGESLDSIIESREVFTPEAAYSYMAQIFDGLEVAHTHKVIHRDLKPENIKVVDDRIPYTIKIMDFGISRTLAEGGMSTSGLTNLGDQFGTPHYMSPEQAEGDIAKIKATSDIYSTGVILFCMLTGEFPFDDDHPATVMHMHLKNDPPVPSSINPQISSELDAVILKAMAKEPADRWQSASEFKAALRQVTLGDEEPEPLTSKPPIEIKNAVMDGDPGEEETIPANMVDIDEIVSSRQAAPPDAVQVELPTVVAQEEPESKENDPKSSLLTWVLFGSVAFIVIGFLVWAVIAKSSSCREERIEVASANFIEKPEGWDEAVGAAHEESASELIQRGPLAPVVAESKTVTVEELKPYDQTSWNGVQKYLGNKSNCLRARSTLEILVKHEPNFPDPHFFLAECYRRSKKHKHKANDHYKKFLQLAPDHEWAWKAKKYVH